MPQSYKEYDTGLSATTFSVPFNYLNIDNINAIGFDGTNWTPLTIASRSASANTITLASAPSAFTKIRVFRQSAVTQLVDFQAGARLTESELDTAYNQGLFVAQEVSEDANTVQFGKLADAALLASTSLAAFNSSSHTGDNSTVTFDLSFTPQTSIPQGYIVAVDGVLQSPVDAYTISIAPAQITFTSAPPTGAKIVVTTAAAATGVAVNDAEVTTTGSNTSRKLEDRFADVINVRDFGAVGDGVADDTSAIQSAINSAFSSGRKDIFIPVGTYRTTATLVVNGTGVRIKGEGAEFSTSIVADFVGTSFTNSPVFRLDGRFQQIQSLGITSSSTREASSNQYAAGIHIEATDSATNNSWFGEFSDLEIQKQPGNGILCVGMVILSSFTRLKIHDCKQHGIRFDSGYLTSRTNKSTMGQNEIEGVMIYDNLGHGILIGNENDDVSNRGYRFNIINADLYRNADAAGSRLSESQLHAFCDTTTIENSAFDGKNRAMAVGITKGITIAGRSNTIRNCRFLEVASNAIRIEQHTFGGTVFKTLDITVSGLLAFQTTNLDPAIYINPNISMDTINIDVRSRVGITSVIETTVHKPIRRECFVQTLGSTKSVTNSTTLTDTTLDIPLSSGNSRAYFRYLLYYRSPATADVKFQFKTVEEGTSTSLSPAPTISFAPINSLKLDANLNANEENVKFSEANALVFGAESESATLVAEIAGEIRTNGSTDGTLKLQFTQNSAASGTTELLPQSHMMYWK